jgi:hypothetical protein
LSTIGVKTPEYLEITKILKYRGEPFMYVEDNGELKWIKDITVKT